MGTVTDLSSLAGAINLPNALTFSASPTTSFTLTSVDPGIFAAAACVAAPAAGQKCTLPNDAFNLMNTEAGSTLSFTVRGNALDGLDTSPFVGTFTTQFSGLSYQDVIAILQTTDSVSAAFSADFQVVPDAVGADLVITKTDGAQNVPHGATITYTIVVTNLGPNTATNVPVIDIFPDSFSSVSWTCTASSGTCGAPNGTGDIAITVSLMQGGEATFVITAILDPAVGGPLVNTANVGQDTLVLDPDLTNNTATDSDFIGTTNVPILDPAGMLTLLVALCAVAGFALRGKTGRNRVASR
jgi:uncharacterized repeat protein (TIGR01451 family)